MRLLHEGGSLATAANRYGISLRQYNHAYTRNRRLAEERSRDREDALVAAAMRFQRDNQHHVPKYVWVNMG